MKFYLRKSFILIVNQTLSKSLYNVYSIPKMFLYKNFTPSFLLQYNLCKFTTQKHKFKSDFVIKNGLKR